MKWFYPFILCGLILALYLFSAFVLHAPEARPKNREDVSGLLSVLGLLVLGLWCCAGISWMVWTSYIDLGEAGIRWKEGKESVFMKWEEIASLSQEGPAIALVERGSGKVKALPFVTRKLYSALTRRLKPLSPAQEELLFPNR
jgi:hypothetical protein